MPTSAAVLLSCVRHWEWSSGGGLTSPSCPVTAQPSAHILPPVCMPIAAGGADTIDQNVGKHYGSFMWPLASNYSSGAPDHVNRFFPCPGNHDWGNRGRGNLDAYLEYMPVGGRRTYDVVLDDVHLFALSSDSNEDR